MPPADAVPASTRKWTADERLAVFDRWKKDGWTSLARDEKAMLNEAVPRSSFLALHRMVGNLDGVVADVITQIGKALNDQNERNKWRNGRLDLLEERCARLESTLGVVRGEPDAH